jgi:hypothetical protein
MHLTAERADVNVPGETKHVHVFISVAIMQSNGNLVILSV